MKQSYYLNHLHHVTRMEFDMKDQLIRQTIMTTQKDVEEVKEDLKSIEEKLDKVIEDK